MGVRRAISRRALARVALQVLSPNRLLQAAPFQCLPTARVQMYRLFLRHTPRTPTRQIHMALAPQRAHQDQPLAHRDLLLIPQRREVIVPYLAQALQAIRRLRLIRRLLRLVLRPQLLEHHQKLHLIRPSVISLPTDLLELGLLQAIHQPPREQDHTARPAPHHHPR